MAVGGIACFADEIEDAAAAGDGGVRHIGGMRLRAALFVAPLAIFIWQYVITHALIANPSGSMSAYYYGRCLLALPIALLFLKTPLSQGRDGALFSIPMALAASLSPLVLALFPELPAVADAACLLAGFASTWLYLRVFLMFSLMPVRDVLTVLLGGLSLAYACRMALGFVPQSVLILLGFVMPFLSVIASRRGIDAMRGETAVGSKGNARFAPDGIARSKASSLGLHGASATLYWLVVVEFAVYGLTAGLVRTPYEEAQFAAVVNVGGSLLLLASNVMLLWWVRRERVDMHLSGVCQAILFLLLTVLLTLVLFGSADSPVAAIASLFARFGVYTLLLCLLCALLPQINAHPYVTFGFGWGFFTLATAVGMSAATVAGISRFSATIALVIGYVLCAITFLVHARTKGDDRIFAANADVGSGAGGEDVGMRPTGTCDETDVLTLDDISCRCAEMGERCGLTHREVEVVQLICLGRSKGYIAESLSITENTVRGYAKNAYRKLGIHSRQELLTAVGIK